MSVQERLIQFIEHKGMNKLSFSKSIGRSVSYVTNIVESIGPSSRDKIKQKYPELNMEWLIDGKGEMLINNSTRTREDVEPMVITPQTTVPLLPISAQAGRLDGFSEGVIEANCEQIISPISNAELAISISGDSMSPEYTSGTKVLVKKINDKAFIDWGRTYVLDTCNGVVVKNIYPSENSDYVKCVSVNPNYPPFEIQKSDIYGWYLVLMSLSLK